jgi:hypothetical protein
MLPPDPANASYRLPALADAEFGGIAHPALIRRLGRELAIEEIRGDRVIGIAHRCAAEALPDPRLQALLLHQTDDPLSTHPHLLLEQVPIDPAGFRTDAHSPQTTCAPADAAWPFWALRSTVARVSARPLMEFACRQYLRTTYGGPNTPGGARARNGRPAAPGLAVRCSGGAGYCLGCTHICLPHACSKSAPASAAGPLT